MIKTNSADKVSIITPFRNAAKVLSETVTSVLNQTHMNWELLLFDDGSSDGSFQVAKSFADRDSRILLFSRKDCRGQAFTRNEALEIATGDYIAFLDADDLWEREKLHAQIEFMKQSSADMSYTQYRRFSSRKNRIGRVIDIPAKVIYCDLLKSNSICCSTVLARGTLKEALKSPYPYRDDFVRWLNVLRKGYAAKGLRRPLTLYRYEGSSVSSNKFLAAIRTWRLYRENQQLSLLLAARCFIEYAIRGFLKHKDF